MSDRAFSSGTSSCRELAANRVLLQTRNSPQTTRTSHQRISHHHLDSLALSFTASLAIPRAEPSCVFRRPRRAPLHPRQPQATRSDPEGTFGHHPTDREAKGPLKQVGCSLLHFSPTQKKVLSRTKGFSCQEPKVPGRLRGSI